jgi:hypothetical protein
MKFPTRHVMLPILVAVSFALVSYPVNAGNDPSSATKSKRTPHRVQSGNTASDPSIGASCAYDRAAGRCMIDLGNGRCMDCNAGPMK